MSRSGKWASSNRQSTLPADWPRLRRLILARDPVCTIRTHCHGDLSTEADHIGEPTDHRLEMLRGACKACHKARTQGQAMQARGAGPLRRRLAEPHPGLTA